MWSNAQQTKQRLDNHQALSSMFFAFLSFCCFCSMTKEVEECAALSPRFTSDFTELRVFQECLLSERNTGWYAASSTIRVLSEEQQHSLNTFTLRIRKADLRSVHLHHGCSDVRMDGVQTQLPQDPGPMSSVCNEQNFRELCIQQLLTASAQISIRYMSQQLHHPSNYIDTIRVRVSNTHELPDLARLPGHSFSC